MTTGGVPDSETARRVGSMGGGDNMQTRECPFCGEGTKQLAHHLRGCNQT